MDSDIDLYKIEKIRNEYNGYIKDKNGKLRYILLRVSAILIALTVLIFVGYLKLFVVMFIVLLTVVIISVLVLLIGFYVIKDSGFYNKIVPNILYEMVDVGDNPLSIISKKKPENINKLVSFYPRFSTQSFTMGLSGLAGDNIKYSIYFGLKYFTQSNNSSVIYFLGNAIAVYKGFPGTFQIRTKGKAKVKGVDFKVLELDGGIKIYYDNYYSGKENIFVPFTTLVNKYYNKNDIKNIILGSHDGVSVLTLETRKFLKKPKEINAENLNLYMESIKLKQSITLEFINLLNE
ncbi:MAG: hypothetical protein OCD02_19760 [Spirochaetaceae bacterium]